MRTDAAEVASRNKARELLRALEQQGEDYIWRTAEAAGKEWDADRAELESIRTVAARRLAILRELESPMGACVILLEIFADADIVPMDAPNRDYARDAINRAATWRLRARTEVQAADGEVK